MNTEIEAKFFDIDIESIREKLREIGAVCEAPMRMMRRAIIDFPDRRLQTGTPNSFVRVRDEGGKVTLTYKRFNSLSIDGAKEIEVTTSSFEDTVQIFTSVGMRVVSLQESKRETWKMGSSEIVIDEWPWLNPYIEIEGESEESVKNAAASLGLVWKEAAFGDVMVAYRHQYPHLTEKDTVGTLEEVRFASPFPEAWVR